MAGAKSSTKASAGRARSKAAKQPVTKRESVAVDPRPARRIRPRRYKSLRFSKRIKHPVQLPSTWKMAKQARQLLWQNWRLIGGIVLIYGVLNMVLVRGLNGGADVRQLKHELDGLFHGTLGHLAAGVSIFALLVSSSATTSANNNAPVYQTILTLVVSLALIWTFRQLFAGNAVRIRDAYYRGMYPLVPVILVLLVISLELVPMLAGGWLLSVVLQNGIAITAPEKFLWWIIFGLLALLSLYLITSSIFAIYIATLADMTPMKALRSARELVRFRRWTVLRKLLFLPLWLLIVGTLVMLPFIWLVPIAAQWIFFILAMIGLAIGHAYVYILYRELLREKN